MSKATKSLKAKYKELKERRRQIEWKIHECGLYKDMLDNDSKLQNTIDLAPMQRKDGEHVIIVKLNQLLRSQALHSTVAKTMTELSIMQLEQQLSLVNKEIKFIKSMLPKKGEKEKNRTSVLKYTLFMLGY